ncbi:MAG: branched-chain amino acid ABC transporter permease [Candidatus Eremiobacterota bacterium]
MQSYLKQWGYLTLGCLALLLVDRFLFGILNGFWQNLVLLAGINMVAALGLNLINGYCGQFSLGHAGFMAIGGYVAAFFTMRFAWPQWMMTVPTVEFPVMFPLSLIMGGLAAAAAGVVVGIPTLRLKGDYLAIATLGFGEIAKVFFQNYEYLGGARGLPGIPHLSNFFWVFATVMVSTVLILNLIRSSHGRALISVREDELAAEVMGVWTTYYKVAAFLLGAFFAGVAGGLLGHQLEILTPEKFNFITSIEIVVIVVVGGMGSTSGVLMAAALLTAVPELLRFIPQIAEGIPGLSLLGEPSMRMILYSLLMIFLMIYRPKGLCGNREIWEILRDRKSTS